MSRHLPSKGERQTVLSQARGSPQLIEFLTIVLEAEISDNIFTEGYGEERAYRDGKAHSAIEILKLLKGMTNE